jgi:hypothetical protein
MNSGSRPRSFRDVALAHVVGPAIDREARVRFLTGTFGNVTRLRTFKRLWRWSQRERLKARIWHSDFHAKLTLWRTGANGHCWIGSSNLTDQGLEREGELIAEITAPWDSVQFRKLKRAFDAEWANAVELDQAFLRSYQEAPRVGKLLNGRARTRPLSRSRKRRAPTRSSRQLLVLPVRHHHEPDGITAQRIDAMLGGSATSWYRAATDTLRYVKVGQLCLIVDAVDKTLELVAATDTGKDRRAHVVAYDPVIRNATRPATPSVMAKLTKLGLTPTTNAFRTKWLSRAAAADVVEAIYGRRFRLRYERDLGA